MRPCWRAGTLVALLGAGCAGGGGRAFEREGFRDLPRQTIELLVASSAVRPGTPRIDAEPLDPIEASTPLTLPTSDPRTTRALTDELRARLEASGYVVRTSSVSVGATVLSRREASDADLIFVIRAQPFDDPMVEEDRGGKPSAGFGAPPPLEPRSGRLLLGQGFVFDRVTGVRVWSHNQVHQPESGALRLDTPILAQAALAPPGETMDGRRRPGAAARAFLETVLGDFPDASAGDPAARARLSDIDREVDEARARVLETRRYLVGVDLSYGAEALVAEVLAVDTILDARTLAPNGAIRLTPSVGMRLPGGFQVQLGIPLGIAPGAVRRGFVRDGQGLTLAFPDRHLFGLQMTAHPSFLIGPNLILRSGFGAFAEIWFLRASPEGFLANEGSVTRVGALLTADAQWRLTDDFFLTAGARGRLGTQATGGFTGSAEGFVGGGLEH